jgi:hypothetical protein
MEYIEHERIPVKIVEAIRIVLQYNEAEEEHFEDMVENAEPVDKHIWHSLRTLRQWVDGIDAKV